MTNEYIEREAQGLSERLAEYSEAATRQALIAWVFRSLLEQGYDEAARAVCIYCAADKVLAYDRGTPYHPQGSIWIEEDGTGVPRDAPCHASAVHALKASLVEKSASSLP